MMSTSPFLSLAGTGASASLSTSSGLPLRVTRHVFWIAGIFSIVGSALVEASVLEGPAAAGAGAVCAADIVRGEWLRWGAEEVVVRGWENWGMELGAAQCSASGRIYRRRPMS